MENLQKLKIGNTDIFLEDTGENMGKITISDTCGHNYSMFWGAMGGSIRNFLKDITPDYFVDKLLGARSSKCIDCKRTFTVIRKYIQNDIGLKWYQHLEFQKQMRDQINAFQTECECEDHNGERYFVDHFPHFIDRLEFYLIDDKYDRNDLEKNFKAINEPWHFIETKENQQSIWLKNLLKKLKENLKKDLNGI